MREPQLHCSQSRLGRCPAALGTRPHSAGPISCIRLMLLSRAMTVDSPVEGSRAGQVVSGSELAVARLHLEGYKEPGGLPGEIMQSSGESGWTIGEVPADRPKTMGGQQPSWYGEDNSLGLLNGRLETGREAKRILRSLRFIGTIALCIFASE